MAVDYISTHRAAAVSDLKRNGFISRGKSSQINRKRKASNDLKSNSKMNRKKRKRAFFELPRELQRCMFVCGMRDRIRLQKQDLEEVRIQRLERRAKEKIAKEKSLKHHKID